jgi:hypothetical protein
MSWIDWAIDILLTVTLGAFAIAMGMTAFVGWVAWFR